jgi:signal peptidase I
MPSPRSLALVCLRSLVAALLLVLLLRTMLFTSYRVAGSSMRETLQDGDRILVCQADWLVQPPAVGDTVVAEVEDEVLVKRVAAGPGDSIGMSRGRVLRNGLTVAEAIPPELDCGDSFPPVLLGADEYFLLGDHRRVSVDSREFGPVHARQVLGRVLLRIHGGDLLQVAALERRGS